MLRLKRSKIDFKQCSHNYIFPLFSFPQLMWGISDWDGGGGKQCCEGDKQIKEGSSEQAEWNRGKWRTKGPGPQSMVSRKKWRDWKHRISIMHRICVHSIQLDHNPFSVLCIFLCQEVSVLNKPYKLIDTICGNWKKYFNY